MVDLGRRLWGEYLERHFRPAGSRPAIENVGAGKLAELIFPLLAIFRPKLTSIEDVPFDEAHDPEADEALNWLATDGTFERWEQLSGGAWRVLLARSSFSVAALSLEELAGTPFMVPLPRDAPERQRATAALLLVLGTFGRKPLPPWRDELPPAMLRIVAPAPSTRQ